MVGLATLISFPSLKSVQLNYTFEGSKVRIVWISVSHLLFIISIGTSQEKSDEHGLSEPTHYTSYSPIPSGSSSSSSPFKFVMLASIQISLVDSLK
jgi:hypothetical protein